MITIKSEREIEVMKESGAILASIHEQLADFIKVGTNLMEIEKFVKDKIEAAGGVAAQIGFDVEVMVYPYATCTSLNDEICHGLPRDYKLVNGDLIKVDFCVDYKGGISDSCWAYGVGELDPEVARLREVTLKALYLGIEQARDGNRIGDIGHAIQTYVEEAGFSVVEEFVGHGIGPTIHEDPMIPHYGQKGKGKRLKKGMTITIEPMINLGKRYVMIDDNNFTARTYDGSICCQFEHSLVITDGEPIITTKQSKE
ncbi:MAG: type I methionyl aminopeptidase [Lactobacillales bacterium]|jgi:methionyl aminopeptidase|nr:type I methionyl aminopeptidase [Lactobacillales bacterium]